MCENSQSSVDEAINNDDGIAGTPLTLSKKAIHQRDADENLFLRFLELDPPVESTPAPPPTPQTGELRRKSTLKSKENPANKEHPVAVQSHNQNGRTPFTITKKLTRTAEKGFGFSIVWTHPPRIEKVEAGLSADRCGILPGDYVIFVDKHNVVTMPEMDILNLIKTQGNTLVLEIFRRSNASRPTTNGFANRASSLTSSNNATTAAVAVNAAAQAATLLNNNDELSSEFATPKQSTSSLAARPMTACSNLSLTLESTKRRLHLPQVTFSKEAMLVTSIEDSPRKYLYQLINREQHFVTALQYGMQRFVSPLQERRDLISPTDHRTLFQNIEEILRLSEDILEQLIPDEHEPQLMFASRVYLSKSTAFCAAYKKYCNGLKRADCVLVNKSRQSNSDFVTFITVPQVPRKRPDMTTLIHRPLQHFREVLKLIILLASHCRPNSEECKNFTHVISSLQTSYREITVNEGIMEPLGEGRPLLTLQDLEARLVFTKCKPFVLAIPGRQWIFGGDLSRVEGRSVKPYWTLLFSDILLFAKVSRDRVLFITEEPIPLANIIDSCFTIRKKHTEFRITIDPNGRIAAESPTVHCTPDLTRTPRKSARKQIILRAPSPELKAVWQNLIQRQVFLVNATLGSTLSSPLESPDILQRFLPVGDIGPVTTSMASIKLSVDSINTNTKSQQSQTTELKQFDELVDEKCRLLNKNGTSHGSALHLSQWMKGQFDESIKKLTEENSFNDIMTEDENEELIEEWSQEQLRKRSQELQLVDENGKCIVPLLDNRRGPETIDRNRLVADDGLVGEFDDGSKSASTTSDSQITVRSSPVTKKIDKLSVCRHCHKNCKQKSPKTSSLKVQHSQSSSSRCCASTSSQGSEKSVSSRTSNQSKRNEPKTSPKTKSSRDGSPASQKTVTTTTCSNSNALNNNILCKCKCTTADFQNTIRTPHEIRKETCKILNSVSEIHTIQRGGNWQHVNCNCDNVQTIRESKISNLNENEYIKSTSEISNVDDWSSKLIGSSQFRAIPSVMRDENDPFKAVPKISVVPPTPDGITNATVCRSHWEQMSSEQSPEDSPQDELPYRALNTSLKRYGTISSLEKMPSDEDDKTYNSSDTETNDNDDDDIRIVTKEIYDGSTRNWTNRAGSFLEQSRAFLDSYLGRWDRNNPAPIPDEDRDDSVPENGEECTSGATSGEEIWGTPTSGENDEIQMFNSDQTSPTKSSSSLTGDDDTELMMDELLMAPPMTASTIRGLLPRRRLEPLFEEDTESSSESDENDENDERMVRDFSSSDQGQAAQKISTQNGRDVESDGVAITTTTSSSSTVLAKSACTVSILPKVPVRNRCIVEPLRKEIDCGGNADAGFSPAQPQHPLSPTKDAAKEKQIKFADVIDCVDELYSAGNKSTGIETTMTATTTVYQTAIRLSPRLEMRLALNHDILGDEDLISFEPGPANLEAILGRDLSSYHRFTGKDLINYRTPNHHRIAPKEANISFSTQKNSKMDTPTPNRRKSNLNTWNDSACAAAAIEKKLSDLERLARAEKKIQLKTYPAEPQSINHGQMAIAEPNSNRNEPKSRGFFGFFKRRNSDTHNTSNGKLVTKAAASPSISSQKDVDKSLDRRFWKQLNKRRRSLSEVPS